MQQENFFPDTCSDDWLTFDNSCYKIEKNLDLDQNQGLQHCSNRYNAQLAVINSREEALFLGSALDDLRVCTTTSLYCKHDFLFDFYLE